MSELTRRLEQAEWDIQKLKREMDKVPLRIEPPLPVKEITLISWGLIIEAPIYPDPPEDPDGQSYYIVRPIETSYDIWESGENYIVCNHVAYPTINDSCYHCIVDCPNSTTPPPEDPTHWEISEEIKIEYVLGGEQSPTKDIRNCVPWYEVGEVVPYISRLVGENTRYYLYEPFYTGEEEDSSLRYNPDEKRTAAVFK